MELQVAGTLLQDTSMRMRKTEATSSLEPTTCDDLHIKITVVTQLAGSEPEVVSVFLVWREVLDAFHRVTVQYLTFND